MSRATCAVASRRRRKRLMKRTRGYWGDRKNHVAMSTEALMRALAFNYRHRKHNKRNFRRLWITRIGIAARMNGISYSKMMHGLIKAGCELNRKMLADLAISDPATFAAIAAKAKAALA